MLCIKLGRFLCAYRWAYVDMYRIAPLEQQQQQRQLKRHEEDNTSFNTLHFVPIVLFLFRCSCVVRIERILI